MSTEQIYKGASVVPGTPLIPIPKKELNADRIDGIFAVLFTILGYLYVQFKDLGGSGLRPEAGLTLFTLVYVATVIAYLLCKKVKIPVQSFFWLAALFAITIPYAFFANQTLDFAQFLFAHLVAVYWTLSASGALIQNKTSNWFFIDAINGAFVMPGSNFTRQWRVYWHMIKKTSFGKTLLWVVLGMLICLPLFAVIFPLLTKGDANFGRLIDIVGEWFQSEIVKFAFYFVLSIPVAAYLYGVINGSLRKSGVSERNREGFRNAKTRQIPTATICTVLLAVSAIYIIFLGMQGEYFFSAFIGARPEGLSFAENARQGFFELCTIACINLAVLWGANLFVRKSYEESQMLRICNLILSALSILLIITAFAKLALYIERFGLTELRILAALALVWFTLMFTAIIIWQWKKIPLIRLGIIAGMSLFCLTCMVDLKEVAAWITSIVFR